MSTTNLSTAMNDFQERVERMADDAPSPDADDPGDAAAPGTAAPEGIPEPDAVDDATLRWAQFVVEKVDVQPGDILFIKAPSQPRYDDKLDQAYDSITHVLEKAGIAPVSIVLGTPKLTISKLDPEQLKRFGYVYQPSAADSRIIDHDT